MTGLCCEPSAQSRPAQRQTKRTPLVVVRPASSCGSTGLPIQFTVVGVYFVASPHLSMELREVFTAQSVPLYRIEPLQAGSAPAPVPAFVDAAAAAAAVEWC